MNKLLKLHITKFKLEEYGIGEGMKIPPHPILKNKNSFNLSVENCNITDVRILFRIVSDQLKIEEEIIKKTEKANQDVHPLQYGVREFLSNILKAMKKIEGIDDLGYYVIKTR